ncbi:hypothetical protein BGX34_005197 [Mortierella sp. NVP85]|nr:hypothetical protein BGX34_005197 [Mortierella sp. NVP85]
MHWLKALDIFSEEQGASPYEFQFRNATRQRNITDLQAGRIIFEKHQNTIWTAQHINVNGFLHFIIGTTEETHSTYYAIAD